MSNVRIKPNLLTPMVWLLRLAANHFAESRATRLFEIVGNLWIDSGCRWTIRSDDSTTIATFRRHRLLNDGGKSLRRFETTVLHFVWPSKLVESSDCGLVPILLIAGAVVPFVVGVQQKSKQTQSHSRCGGDGCALKLDTWTKAPELVVSFLKDHTEKCPSRPIFCPKGTCTRTRNF